MKGNYFSQNVFWIRGKHFIAQINEGVLRFIVNTFFRPISNCHFIV